MITLRCEGCELLLAPAAGGTVRALRLRGEDLLRPAPAGNDDPLASAAFPLVPFSGRIDRGRFRFRDEAVTLAPNFPPEAHAIHGQGWQRAWTVERADATSADLVYRHDGADWPWRYRATQAFRLRPDGLELGLALANESDRPMPAGLGWHPYFPRADATLTAAVRRIWPSGETTLVDPPRAPKTEEALHAPRPVDALALDHCFDADAAGATIHWPRRGLRLRLTGDAVLRFLIVYTPPGQDFFCVEPVSHAPDAVHSPLPAAETGLRMLEPGETLRAGLRLVVQAQPGGGSKP
ncbi:MAG: aldose 1-epimerase [Pseudomonadales bacterium]|jgi:aldose 1-epimerase|nr:aldose 1-epimerase [Pseudomonadales bacterium]